MSAGRFDAVVIGGGPAGATSALLLARAGWSVAVIERAAFPRHKVCGEFVSASSLPLLQHLGLAEAFLDEAGPEVRHVGLCAGGSLVTARMPRLADGGEGWGRALGRDRLDTLLLSRAQAEGATVFQPFTVTEIRTTAVGGRTEPPDEPIALRLVCARTRGEFELRARVAIAAHGSWDAGQLTTQPERRQPRGSDLFGFKARLVDARLPAGLMPLIAFPGGYGGMVRTDRGRVSVSCCIRRDVLDECRRRRPGASAGQAVLAHIVSTGRAAGEILGGASVDGEWRSAGPIRPGIRSTHRDGVFFAGNAAGEAHPVVAEGISMAMQSGWLLASALTASADAAVVRQVYAAGWRRLVAPRIMAAAAIAHWAMRPPAVAATLPLVRMFPVVLTLGARASGKALDLRVCHG